MPELPDPGNLPSDSTRRWRRIALWASLVFHVVLLSALGVWIVGRGNVDRLAPFVAERTQTPSLPPRRPLSPDVSSKQVSATLDKATEKYASIPISEQLNELDKQAARLESLSSEKSVDEIAAKFQEWIPTSRRASEPSAEVSSGEFDFDTAQIHDVLRSAAADGSWNYRSVLIDAGGRTFEVEIDRAAGENMYAAFESLKKFPLANQVYRQIAMGLMDRALQAERSDGAVADSPPVGSVKQGDSNLDVADDRDPFDNSGSPR